MQTGAHQSSDPIAQHLLPASIVGVCEGAGLVAPSLHDALRIAYLGCGDGDTALHIAAEHPNATVWAWDPNVEHVEIARRRRDAAGLANLHVHERSVVPDDLGGATDVVVLDDVLVTVGDEGRQRLVATVGSALRPGGLVCVSYRTTVGWGSIVPMVTFLRHVVRRHAGDRVDGIARAVDLMRRMVECEAAYVADRPEVAAWVSDVSVTDPRLIAAAYLGADFRPLSHAQVVRELAPIGCSFVGRVASADEPVLSSELRAIVDGAANRTIREAYDDLATRRAHRVDVFRLGTVTPGMV